MTWSNNLAGSPKKAYFTRLIVGTEEHDAMMRYAEKCYEDAIQVALRIARNTMGERTPELFATTQTLLNKIASPLIYVEMDWKKLPIREKAQYAKGKYGEAIANKIRQMSPQNPHTKEGYAT